MNKDVNIFPEHYKVSNLLQFYISNLVNLLLLHFNNYIFVGKFNSYILL